MSKLIHGSGNPERLPGGQNIIGPSPYFEPYTICICDRDLVVWYGCGIVSCPGNNIFGDSCKIFPIFTGNIVDSYGVEFKWAS